MKTPMIFIHRDSQPVDIDGNITFEEFMKTGYKGLMPVLEDYELQANLCFPEVRLRVIHDDLQFLFGGVIQQFLNFG